jgi:phosphoglucosamine mutase
VTAVDRARIERYEAAVIGSISPRTLEGLRVVIDCANGAASTVAPGVLRRLGADIVVINAEPDGRNINASCGSTYPQALQAAVVEHGADAGLAFDGDADRLLGVDERGVLFDGDHLIAMCTLDLRERGELVDDTVVITVMTNLGFRLAMAEHGIEVIETQVGDRYVLEALEAGGYSIGGEQSGHVIFRRLATTGDGLLTGVQLLDLLARAGRPLSELAAASMTQLPQVLHNVRVAHRDPEIATKIAGDIAAVEAELGAHGRVLVRPSGTEALVRVMIEAPDPAVADAAATRLIAAVEAAS